MISIVHSFAFSPGQDINNTLLFQTMRVTTDYLNNNNRMCVCLSVCLSVCACVISEQLNQENGKSYGTGFFGKVQRIL